MIYPIRLDPRFRLPLLLFGVIGGRNAYARLTSTTLEARFGFFSLAFLARTSSRHYFSPASRPCAMSLVVSKRPRLSTMRSSTSPSTRSRSRS